MHNNKIAILQAVLWTILITFLSIATLDNVGSQIKIENKDKMIHFVFYFLFVFLWIKANNKNNFLIKKPIYIFLIAVLYGILMEICQGIFTTTRTPDFFDVLANTTGATMGLLFSNKYFSNKKV